MSAGYYCTACGRFTREPKRRQLCSASGSGFCEWRAEGTTVVWIERR